MEVVQCPSCESTQLIDVQSIGAMIACRSCGFAFLAMSVESEEIREPEWIATSKDALTNDNEYQGLRVALQQSPRRSSSLTAAAFVLNIIAFIELVSIIILGIVMLVAGSNGVPFVDDQKQATTATRVIVLCFAIVFVRDLIVMIGASEAIRRASFPLALTSTVLTVLPVTLFIGIASGLSLKQPHDAFGPLIIAAAVGYSLIWYVIGAWVAVLLLRLEARQEFVKVTLPKIAKRKRTAPEPEVIAAHGRLELPAAALLAVGSLNFLWNVFAFTFIHLGAVHTARPILPNEQLARLLCVVFVIGLNVTQIVAAVRIQSLQSYPFAISGALIGLIPCTTCAPWTIPVGVWLLAELLRPQTRAAFR